MAEEKGKNPKGAGKSSFDLIDLKKISDVLPVKPGSVVLDLACGRGDYSVYFSEIVGEQGLVYALDLWEEGTKLLEKRIEKQNITNIMTLISDAARPVRPNISGCRKKRWMIWSWGTDLKKAALLMQGITPICCTGPCVKNLHSFAPKTRLYSAKNFYHGYGMIDRSGLIQSNTQ